MRSDATGVVRRRVDKEEDGRRWMSLASLPTWGDDHVAIVRQTLGPQTDGLGSPVL